MTMNFLHFEDLWEKCENYHKDHSNNDSLDFIFDNLHLKINLLKSLLQKENLPVEEAQQAKKVLLGEIIFTLTSLSLKENINVFDALNTVLHYNTIQNLSKKYSE